MYGTEENVTRVFKLQKRAAGVILDSHIRDRSKDLFRRLDWLPFKDEVNLQQCSLIFRRIRNEDDCPDYITKLLPRNSDLSRDSRASRYGRFNLLCPFYNRETEGGSTFKVRGATLWNKIPLEMRKKDNAGAFKNALKKYFSP